MKQYLRHYQTIMAKRFITYSGGIFVVEGRNTAARVAKCLERDPRPICHAENEHNHYHFDHEFSEDRWDNFLKNRHFAEAARVAWGETLKARREKGDYRLIVCNRLTSVESAKKRGVAAYHVFPTISAWSKGPGTEALDELFCVDQLSYDFIWYFHEWPVKPRLIGYQEAKAMVETEPWSVDIDN